jgi:hypothetical protein
MEEFAMRRYNHALFVGLVGLSGCGFLPDFGNAISRTFDFNLGQLGWEADVADYGPDQEETISFVAELRNLPDELNSTRRGYFVSGRNASDDLFMFLKRRLTPDDGIEPNRTYRVSFTIVFASNAPSGCVGVGGAPGESVYLKAGATNVEPLVIFDNDEDLFLMNVDKGNQAQGGPAASLVGHIANGIPCASVPDLNNAPYVSLTRLHTHSTLVTASDEGDIWLLIGTDSGYESTTALYYRTIQVRLLPIGPADGS